MFPPAAIRKVLQHAHIVLWRLLCFLRTALFVAVGPARRSLLSEMTAHVVTATFHLASGRLFILLNCTGGGRSNRGTSQSGARDSNSSVINAVLTNGAFYVFIYSCVGIWRVFMICYFILFLF